MMTTDTRTVSHQNPMDSTFSYSSLESPISSLVKGTDLAPHLFSCFDHQKTRTNFSETCKALHTFYLKTSMRASALHHLHSKLLGSAEQLVRLGKENYSIENLYNQFQKELETRKINPNHSDYATYIWAYRKIYNKIVVDQLTLEKRFPFSIEFNTHTLKKVYEAYGQQSLEEITPESFMRQVELVNHAFLGHTTIAIEAQLRNAIQSSHSINEINEVKGTYDLVPTNPRFIAEKAALEGQLSQEKQALHKEFNAVSKDPAFDEAEVKKCEERRIAEREMSQATQLLLKTPARFKSSDGYYATPQDYNLYQLVEAVAKKLKIFEKKRAACGRFARIDDIAQYDPDTKLLCRGELLELQFKLESNALEAAVRVKMSKMIEFYKELAIPVGESQEFWEERSRALSLIVKSN